MQKSVKEWGDIEEISLIYDLYPVEDSIKIIYKIFPSHFNDCHLLTEALEDKMFI